MSIDCSTESYAFHRFISLLFLTVYGAGIPLGLSLLGIIIRKACGRQAEQETFAFLMAGYRPQYRYWEAVHMFLKTGVIVVATFLEDPWRRIYCAIYLLAAFLLLVQVECAAYRPCRA